jgi:superoxide dismutase, Cu-Zn family
MKRPRSIGGGRTTGLILLLALSIAALAGAGEARAQVAEGELIDAEGAVIGEVTLSQMARGVHIMAQASGLPPGVHGFHIHAVGICEPPFESAGGHFNPTDEEHGWNNPQGHHSGDLPNVHVQEDGVLAIEYLTDAVTLGEGETTLFDADGSSIVVHADADDYRTARYWPAVNTAQAMRAPAWPVGLPRPPPTTSSEVAGLLADIMHQALRRRARGRLRRADQGPAWRSSR